MLFDPKWEIESGWRDVLRRAADLIERKGHCKNKPLDTQGRHCIAGAIHDVGGTASDIRMATIKMHEFACGNFVAFNNAPETMPDEVVSAMRQAAAVC